MGVLAPGHAHASPIDTSGIFQHMCIGEAKKFEKLFDKFFQAILNTFLLFKLKNHHLGGGGP